MRLGITGHRGMPPSSEEAVRVALAEVVQGHDPGELVGVSCIADGPDAWFVEAVLAHGGRVEVVIPAMEYREGLPEEHHALYDELLRRAAEVHSTGMKESTSKAHQAGSEMLVGLADELVAVWDGLPARGYGGTADVVAYARGADVPVRVVWPEGATRD
ncbi:hypothetical protein [Streptomyces sp. TS71-3]|uniref:hypothetical protein n=1 Tax=Streptomyces sp. TS71-3 TaxID=2733862 RepID=UPI001B18D4F2|nr:hypothetical protein [Streptomyces sp. TS71-3]GHJ40417.1 hypothetical protein Sm713_60260 [Streptomyces sp. TS71-3]